VVRLALLVLLAPSTVFADPAWQLDLSARTAASLASSSAPNDRVGIAPAILVRATHRLGPLHVGGTLGAGFPAYYGQHEASLALQYEHALGRCADPCRRIITGADLGIAMLFHDAPPESSASSEALLYYGPLARARVELRTTWETPTGKQIGFTIGLALGATRATYMTTTEGTSMRLEPSATIGLALGL
jgi:hypothetical protein